MVFVEEAMMIVVLMELTVVMLIAILVMVVMVLPGNRDRDLGAPELCKTAYSSTFLLQVPSGDLQVVEGQVI